MASRWRPARPPRAEPALAGHSITPRLVLVVAALLGPAPTAAQWRPQRPSPTVRVDVALPAVGLGGFWAPAAAYQREFGSASVGVRVAERSGNGAMLQGVWATSWWATAWGVELDYLHRVRFSGDDRSGAALDLMIGPTLASLHHDEGTVPAGAAVGGNVAVSLDGRLDGFVLSIGLQYRLLVPLEPPEVGGASAEHALSGTLTAGFGFWD